MSAAVVMGLVLSLGAECLGFQLVGSWRTEGLRAEGVRGCGLSSAESEGLRGLKSLWAEDLTDGGSLGLQIRRAEGLRSRGIEGLKVRAQSSNAQETQGAEGIERAEGAEGAEGSEKAEAVEEVAEPEGAEETGDPDALAAWLLDQVLSTNGSKKKLNLVQAELSSLDLTTEDAVRTLRAMTLLERSYASKTAMGFVLKLLGDLVDGRIPGTANEYTGAPKEVTLPVSSQREASKFIVAAIQGDGWISGRWLHKLVRIMRLTLEDLREAGLYMTMPAKYVNKELDLGEDVVPPTLIKFLGLAKTYPVQPVVLGMIVNDQWGVAEEMIRVVSNKEEDVLWFVEQAINQEKWKIALRMSLSYHLATRKNEQAQALSKKALLGYKQEGVQKLLNRQMYEGAQTYVATERDEVLKEEMAIYLFNELLLVEQFELASTVRSDFRIEQRVQAVGKRLIERAMEERRRREEGNFKVPDSCPVYFIDNLETMREARGRLATFCDSAESGEAEGQFLLSIDTEWRPVRSSDEKIQISILQIGCQDSSQEEFVMIFDMQAIMAEDGGEPNAKFEEMSELYVSALQRVCRSERVAKVGFQLSDDLKKLARVHPQLSPAFSMVHNVIDLASWQRAIQFPSTQQMWSLARLAQEYLDGAVLCKQQCMSDWSARPLTAAQMKYASSDAYVLIPLYNTMLRRTDIRPIPYKFASQAQDE